MPGIWAGLTHRDSDLGSSNEQRFSVGLESGWGCIMGRKWAGLAPGSSQCSMLSSRMHLRGCRLGRLQVTLSFQAAWLGGQGHQLHALKKNPSVSMHNGKGRGRHRGCSQQGKRRAPTSFDFLQWSSQQ